MAKAADPKDTPMLKQYLEFKAKYPDAVILYRVGDFYETFCEDAQTTHDILGITLTARAGNPLAGFPYHALDTYLPKLVRAGKRVAICEQLEDPKLTKKLVKRGVTELITPGLSMGDNVLNARENNFLASVTFASASGKASQKNAAQVGLALLDISTGEFMVAEGSYDYIDKLIGNYAPKEILFVKGMKPTYQEHFTTQPYSYELDDYYFGYDNAVRGLLDLFHTQNLKGFGIEEMTLAISSAGAILRYLDATQHTNIRHITTIRRIDNEAYMRLDKFTVRSLELIYTMNEGGRSLFDVLDDTTTPMGSRLMHRWVLFPLKHVEAIRERLNVVEYFFRDPDLANTIGEELKYLGDMERIVGKIAVGRVSPREIVQLRVALTSLKEIKLACEQADLPQLKTLSDQINTCERIAERIGREIVPEPPAAVGKGSVIRDGVDSELDELRHMAYSGKDYLISLQQRLSEECDIPSLKVAYNNVFGYYIEVRNTHRDKVPEGWVRKQTLVGAERYITQELKEYEEKILTAEERILALESKIYQDLLNALEEYIPIIQIDAQLMARLDCLLSFSRVAARNRYVRPDVDDSLVIDIRQGRHPVIEQQLAAGESYVPNDVCLSSDEQESGSNGASADKPAQIMMITGPNMAGKSALLRQTALITLMAHIGCFVPAESAHIGIVDKIFTRVGASDNISLGESTFMVEMTEASNILNNLSPRSLVLFDELGRGTSTYDGISIAWSIVEYVHERAEGHPKMLFATHYHELNEMEKSFPRIKNFNVSVREEGGKVLFLRKLKRGGSEHSFGIHVAKLAGMNPEVVKRADEVLKSLEAASASASTLTDGVQVDKIKPSHAPEGYQFQIFQLDDPVLSQVRDEIKGLDLNNMTPMEALNKLAEIKRICGI
ncbi:MAG: DNA mismatch repair protein MutS [Bacteroidales bacterium]|nr:DNA mismatch repair protein MutS [Bacteroidales bacterium]